MYHSLYRKLYPRILITRGFCDANRIVNWLTEPRLRLVRATQNQPNSGPASKNRTDPVLNELKLKKDRDGQPHGLQPAPHLYLPVADGGRGRLSDREKLPDERRDDQEVLRLASRQHARYDRDQRQKGQAPEPEGEPTGKKPLKPRKKKP